jgi:hypothetical protein
VEHEAAKKTKKGDFLEKNKETHKIFTKSLAKIYKAQRKCEEYINMQKQNKSLSMWLMVNFLLLFCMTNSKYEVTY